MENFIYSMIIAATPLLLAAIGELVAERIQKYRWLAPEQTIVTSSCGLNHLPQRTAFGKLKAMTEAKRVLGG